MVITYRFRIKDGSAKRHLLRYARACNTAWNFCVETQRETQRRIYGGSATKWLTDYDLIKLHSGVAATLGVHSDSIALLCRQFVASRQLRRKCPKFRASKGPRRSLGWVPFSAKAIQVRDGYFFYKKRRFAFWKTRELEGRLRGGSFSQDARGRWYVCFYCDVEPFQAKCGGAIGIDLGLKKLVVCSDGTKIEAPRIYRLYERQLAAARRANRKDRIRTINAKVANARRHFHHQISHKFVEQNKFIVVGNVSSSKLAKTAMAKSIYDASWYMLKTQLRYKAKRHGAVFVEVNEAYSSRTCSRCGTIPDSSPKGMGALGIRHWECSNCGCSHDRDVNAAQNILRVGLERQPPAEEIAPLREDVNDLPH